MQQHIVRKSMPMGEGAFHFTTEEMSKAAMGRYGAKSQRIRDLATDIIRDAGISSHDTRGEICALHNWVRDNIRYVKDPAGIEFITMPETLAFDTKQEDCDGHAVLFAALCGAVGIPTRFVIVQTGVNKTFNHVYALAKTSTGWIASDAIIKDKNCGWETPNPIRKRVFAINSDAGIGYISDAALFGMIVGFCQWCRKGSIF